VRWLADLWRKQSLRAHITIVTTTLFAFALVTGAVLLIALQRQSLIHALDSAATKTAQDIAASRQNGPKPPITALAGAGDQIQVVDADDRVVAHSPGTDAVHPLLSPEQLARGRGGERITIAGDPAITDQSLRVVTVVADDRTTRETVLVASGLGDVENSVRILRTTALIGGPLAVLVMALATYFVVGRTLRPVAALRRGAQAITAAGLADQRLPVPGVQDEVHRLAVTLNAMLDRIDAATARQRTFVGDSAHELRSPLASLRIQLEVAQRLGPAEDWRGMIDDILVDVERLERLVADLLALARSDEAGGVLARTGPVRLDGLVTDVTAGYSDARVPITVSARRVTVDGDPDALRRVTLNLLDNAVRHAGSSVHVAVGPAPDTLIVSDDGPGIEPAERERVFDRFYRLHESRSRESGGTGLGLPIVRDLVRAHGGSVRLADNDPHGLRVIVTFPVRS
jgi:signal transduction histidine kinase